MNGSTASYDWENRLYSLGSSASYLYDADGNRVASTAGGATTDYLVDTTVGFPSVVEERNDAGGGLLARYTLGDDLLRMDRSGAASYYVEDGLGSTRALTNASGTVTDTYSYDAYGEQVTGNGSTTNPYRFDAQQLDAATGDYYLRARYYNEGDGRFLSQDPYDGDNFDPITLHRYLYTGNDPVDSTDPGGQDPDLPSLTEEEGIEETQNETSAGAITRAFSWAAGNAGRIAAAHLIFSVLAGLVDPDAAQALAQAEQPFFVFGAEDQLGFSVGQAGRQVTRDAEVYKEQFLGVSLTNGAANLNSIIQDLNGFSQEIRQTVADAGVDAGNLSDSFAEGFGNVSVGYLRNAGGDVKELLALSNRANFPGDTFLSNIRGALEGTQEIGDAETTIIRWFRMNHPDTNYTGKLVLFTQRNPCGICSQAVYDLRATYHNLQVYLLSGGAPSSGPVP